MGQFDKDKDITVDEKYSFLKDYMNSVKWGISIFS